jgi:septin family protein
VPKLAQTFNVIVVGAQGTGKTSLLRLFLDTCEISPNASSEQRASVDRFMSGAGGRTKALRTACVEIAEGRYDRVLLTLIDTPGLDFTSGRELELEKSVSGVVKYLDLQYADTMGEVRVGFLRVLEEFC